MLGTLGQMETKPQASACSSKFQLDPSNYHVNKADKAKKKSFCGKPGRSLGWGIQVPHWRKAVRAEGSSEGRRRIFVTFCKLASL